MCVCVSMYVCVVVVCVCNVCEHGHRHTSTSAVHTANSTALRLTCLGLAFFLQHFVSTPSPTSTRPGLARG